ncbi:SPOR domain-containing protein [Sphingomonas sp. LB-2]|uniref:SPOR domain-containing protein n=1 Tax=Sphingomonas caeni TaxID=2984949 RepID=UPI0022307EEC|nr:SPOR domain-containing protein [Sphingomonas caeni]MCW3848467.1 SPOR domain-containing protein [Sphingomonas caeni]
MAGSCVIAAMPAHAQVSEDEQVKQGVEAWERGDYRAAVDKWRGPAIAGNPDAQFNLGQAYKLGRGVAADLNMAEDWYRKAALRGHPQAEDNYGLALFQNGKRAEAVPWLEKSANRGEPRAQFVLGTMYFNGDGVERDWVRAYALMVRASQSGLPQASAALAQMDKYISLQDRQQGLALARTYEDMANRPQPPVDYSRPATQPTRVAATTTQPNRRSPQQNGTLPAIQPRPTPTPTPPPTQVAAVNKPPVVRPPVTAPVRDGGWRVQLGAFGDPNNARKLWGQVAGRFPGRQVYYVKSGSLTKVLVGPFASRAEAAGSCRGVSPCVPVSN